MDDGWRMIDDGWWMVDDDDVDVELLVFGALELLLHPYRAGRLVRYLFRPKALHNIGYFGIARD